MINEFNLEKLEKSAYMAYHKDGIWDVSLGLFFVAAGILFYYDNVSYLAIMPAILAPLIMQIKKTFAQSRLGYAQFSKERKRKEKLNLVGISIMGTVSFLGGIGAFFAARKGREFYDFLDSLPVNPFAIILILAIISISAVFQVWRFMAYCAFTALVFFIVRNSPREMTYGFIISGLIILMCGFVLLLSFISKYPTSEKQSRS